MGAQAVVRGGGTATLPPPTVATALEDQKPGPVCVAHNHDFAKEGNLQPKVVKFSKKCLNWETW